MTEAPRRLALTEGTDGARLLEVAYLPQAELWRINHGWRRSPERDGFVIDRASGRWMSLRELDDDTERETATDPVTGVKPFVSDTRNLLLLRPAGAAGDAEAFLKSAAHALLRAVQIVHQVEDREIAVELIGTGERRQLLMWEASEGGIGIFERIIAEPAIFNELARAALHLCHFDPQTGEPADHWHGDCSAACYDCLLSYSNQPDHRFLDRQAIREWLLRVTRAAVGIVDAQRPYDEQYGWLRDRTDPASTFERAFLDFLYHRGLRLPDEAQSRPTEDIFVQPDARGQGAGRALFHACAREAVRQECGRMEWQVLDWNAPSIAFYERAGARILKEWQLCRLTDAALLAAAE